MRRVLNLPCPFTHFCFLLALFLGLSGCGPTSYRLAKPGTQPSAVVINEPAANEVVIVINNNSIGGTHAGIFAGSRLNDPSGSYVGKRMENKNWPGPSLSDYVEFQKEDGDNIMLFRFHLTAAQFNALDARMVSATPTPPLFCAAEVKHLIGGIEPFSAIEQDGWISPSGLATLLGNLTREKTGKCEMPNMTDC